MFNYSDEYASHNIVISPRFLKGPFNNGGVTSFFKTSHGEKNFPYLAKKKRFQILTAFKAASLSLVMMLLSLQVIHHQTNKRNT